MTTPARRLAYVLPLLVAATGCGSDPTLDVGHEQAAATIGNGHMQNGHMQNGHMQNGHMQNGVALALAGVDLTSAQRLLVLPPSGSDPWIDPANLVPMPNVKLVNGTLTNGVPGTSFVGVLFQKATLTDGTNNYPAQIYVEDVAPSGSDSEIVHYKLKAYHTFVPADGGGCGDMGACPPMWEYACGTQPIRWVNSPSAVAASAKTNLGGIIILQEPVWAMAMGGQWDYHQGQLGDGRKVIEQGNPLYDTQVTFACTNGAIGKCAEILGYKPWSPSVRECKQLCTAGPFGSFCRPICTQPSKELLHEACVRMVRADYCGDGSSHTVDGITIDVWDYGGFQHPTSVSTSLASGFGHEAEWTPNGARCLPNVLMSRVSTDVDQRPLVEYLDAVCPHKWDNQPNQSYQFRWEDNDCFGAGPASQHSTWNYENVPWGYDWHNRVLLKNTSMCIVDRYFPDMGASGQPRPNPYKTEPPCLPDAP